ncbi:hypothetical protein V462_11290 [Pantoea ananatis 15320]|nr:hypothetical protein V462_11290 [Pantoea ananatis 15320]
MANGMNDMTSPENTLTFNNLAQCHLRKRLSQYRFGECFLLICFLDMCCHERLGHSELFYIRSKLREYLWSYDDGSAWLKDLRLMESEVSQEMELQKKR